MSPAGDPYRRAGAPNISSCTVVSSASATRHSVSTVTFASARSMRPTLVMRDPEPRRELGLREPELLPARDDPPPDLIEEEIPVLDELWLAFDHDAK